MIVCRTIKVLIRPLLLHVKLLGKPTTGFEVDFRSLLQLLVCTYNQVIVVTYPL